MNQEKIGRAYRASTGDPVRVHREIEHRRDRAEAEKREREQGQRRREGDQRQEHGDPEQGDPRHPSAPDAPGEPACERQDDDRAPEPANRTSPRSESLASSFSFNAGIRAPKLP